MLLQPFDGARAVLRVEQGHADQIAARIVQLGGAPNLSPEGMLGRSHSEYVEGESLGDMIRENLPNALPSTAIGR